MSVNYSGLPGIHTTSPQALARSPTDRKVFLRKMKRKECGRMNVEEVKEKTREF